jgi:hypothetical protein
MADWIVKPDVAARGQVGGIAAAITAAPGNFGLMAADAEALNASLAAFADALDASIAAQAAARVAVANKNAARAALENLLRPMIQRVQLDPVVTDEVRASAGIPIRDTVRTVAAPVAPREVVAALASPTTARLVWNSNGNASGVQYVVESKIQGAVAWSLLNVVTATKVDVPNLLAGQRVDFRVRARRGSATSDPSNVASVYAG